MIKMMTKLIAIFALALLTGTAFATPTLVVPMDLPNNNI
jgi:hypothetical protein